MLKEVKKNVAERILRKIFKDGFVDGHNTIRDRQTPSVVVVRYCDGKVDVCYANDRCQYFSVNPFEEYDDNDIILSPGSICGVVDLRYAKNLEEAVSQYNTRHTNDQFNPDEKLYVVRESNLEEAINQIHAF